MSMDETVVSADGTEVAAGYEPEHAFDAEPVEAPLPTQVSEPTQAARRTVIQYLSGALAALVVAGLVRLGLAVPDDVAQAIGVMVGAAVSWLVARLMAIAKADAWLTTIGLGATPKG